MGAQAYFNQINKTNYLKGVKIQFVTSLNDDGDPATTLTDARQLVTQDQVFAIVPDLSADNPGSYLASQGVPYVGGGYDSTYCSTTRTTSPSGGTRPRLPRAVEPTGRLQYYDQFYAYVKSKTGSAHPTVALFSNDNESGSSVRQALNRGGQRDRLQGCLQQGQCAYHGH